MKYEAQYKTPKPFLDTGADYEHTYAEQAAYDLAIYLHQKMTKLPKYEKFTLQKEIRETADLLLDEIETYEVTKGITHLYAADRAKRRLLRKIRFAHDLKYTAINDDVCFYVAKQLATIGKLIGTYIETEKQKGKKGSC